jgi:predicted nucleic acid-binding protein
MRPNARQTVLVDSGFWFALLDERDQHFYEAQSKADRILRLTYILPWPVLYETLCSRFVRRPALIAKFEVFLKRPNAVLLDDTDYREGSLDRVLNQARDGNRTISLVDMVLRSILDDKNINVNGLVSFNVRDFSDVCRRRGIEIV